jgi:hypothetical protein
MYKLEAFGATVLEVSTALTYDLAENPWKSHKEYTSIYDQLLRKTGAGRDELRKAI